jgi:hypothetical protein
MPASARWNKCGFYFHEKNFPHAKNAKDRAAEVEIFALRKFRPRSSGRHERGETEIFSAREPSPDAALGDGIFAAQKVPPGKIPLRPLREATGLK